jgi:GPH family glycoside/pentoside/hexuronide:cation symporter
MSAPIPPPSSSEAPPSRQVPTSRRFMWGLGGATDFITYNSLNGLMDAIYVNAMALDPRIIGLARSIPRLLDLATDPILGHLSDNTRSRWGRRRPWMAAGALLAAVIAILMWYPPLKAGVWVSTTFVVGMSVLLFTCGYSLFMIPYTAQGYELSTDYNERTHIFQWRQYCNAAIGFLGPWIIPLCIWIEGPSANVTRGTVGVHWVSFGIAFLILLTACGPIFGCRERVSHVAEDKTNLRDALRFTLRNKAFWPLVAANFLVKFGMVVTTCFFYFVMVYSVSGGDNRTGTAQLAVFFNSINISTVLAMFLMVRFTDWVGKKTAMITLMLLSSITYSSIWYTLRPLHTDWVIHVSGVLQSSLAIPSIIAGIWPALITGACIGIFTNSMPMVMNSMLADVCDVDELECGKQRQAFYSAVFVTSDKLAMALAMFLQGFLVSGSGYSAKLASQTPETIAYWMKALLFTQPVGFIFGFFCILVYPITRAKAAEVRRLLEVRKVATILNK